MVAGRAQMRLDSITPAIVSTLSLGPTANAAVTAPPSPAPAPACNRPDDHALQQYIPSVLRTPPHGRAAARASHPQYPNAQYARQITPRSHCPKSCLIAQLSDEAVSTAQEAAPAFDSTLGPAICRRAGA